MTRGPQVVNDSKTPSGTVHVGSLRGPVILDAITRALRAAGIETTLLYGVDDLDPMDAQALLTPDAVDHEMGRPLAHVPDQVDDCHASYARHHAQTFIDTFAGLGIHPDRYYWMSEHYAAGDMDPFIRTALDRAALVRDIYKRVANVQHPDTWHPVSVICPNCGKVGTTIVTEWDGERVHFECRPNLVDVGHRLRPKRLGLAVRRERQAALEPRVGRPMVAVRGDGRAATARTSRRPVARATGRDAIAREVFEREPPLNIPYEFLNVGGRKMSTSKGRGAAAHTIAEVVPPEQLRFLFLRPRPNHAIDFDPEGTDADPAPLRRVRQVRRGDRRPRGAWRAAARLRGHVPLFAHRSRGQRGGRGRRVPTAVRAPGDADPDPRGRRRRAGRAREGELPDRPRARPSRPTGGRGAGVARRACAGARRS